jgi:hypothetical protein
MGLESEFETTNNGEADSIEEFKLKLLIFED